MDDVRTQWNFNQKRLQDIILKPDCFLETKALLQLQHDMVHASEMSGVDAVTLEDEVWMGLTDLAFRSMPSQKDETIAWNLWHLTRIEDMTMNILIAGDDQVFESGDWQRKLKVTVKDTGNAMTDDEIMALSSAIDQIALRAYRIAVGRKTKAIMASLTVGDLKRKMERKQLQRLQDEGGLLDVPESIWLMNFWGRKNVAGLMMMPATRHHVVHLNASLRLKEKCSRLTPDKLYRKAKE